MFNGYLQYAGTEIINASRTRAYLKALAPQVGLRDRCCPCDDLAEALGDEPYSSPQQDDAPWLSPYNPNTAGFYGLLPLALQGFEDSTERVPVVESAQEGASFGRTRRGSRPLRVSALAFARDEAAMDAGLAWLRSSLNDSGCDTGDCSGGTVCWLADCPTVCDHSDVPDTPLLAVFTAKTEAEMATLLTDWVSTDTTPTYLPNSRGGSVRFDDTAVVEIPLSPLIPGETYRLEYNAYSESTSSIIEVVGTPARASLYRPPNENYLADMDLAAEVIEFVATDATALLRLTARGSFVGVGGLRLRRVAEASVRYQRWYPRRVQTWPGEFALNYANVDLVQTWAALLPSPAFGGATLNFVVGPSTVSTGALVLNGGVNDFTANARVTIGGFTPGVPARLLLRGSHTYSQAPVSPVVTGSLNVIVDGVSLHTIEGLGAIEFTPRSESVTVVIGPSTSHTWEVNDQNRLVTLEVFAMRAEQVQAGPFDANGVVIDRRTLGSVSVTQGPMIVSTYPERNAVMRRVEWEMVAGAPRPMGTGLPAYVDPDQPTISTRDRQCQNGRPVEFNYWMNPAITPNMNGWNSSVPAGWALTRQAGTGSNGTAGYLNLQRSGVTTTTGVTVASVPGASSGWQAGDTLTVSFDVRTNVSGVRVIATHTYRGTGTTVTGATTGQPTAVGMEWSRMSLRDSVPQGTVATVLSMTFTRPGGWPDGAWVRVDSVRLAPGSSTVYFDGSYPNSTWLGTANSSASSQVAPVAPLIIDPSCPPLPAPPLPPTPEAACFTLPTVWRRRYVSVDPRLTQVGRAAAPVVTLTSGENDAAGIRVRVFPDPFGTPFDLLDPCSACGEFVISYMPPGATLVVDAATRTTSISLGGVTRSADHLLYDSGGGPVVWPEMNCGVPYVIEVSVDASSDYPVDLGVDIVPLY